MQLDKQAEQIKFSLKYKGGANSTGMLKRGEFVARSSLHGDEKGGECYFFDFAASLVRASHMAIKLYGKRR